MSSTDRFISGLSSYGNAPTATASLGQFTTGLKAYQDRQNSLMGQLDVLGQNQLAKANQLHAQQYGQAQQMAHRQGLGNFTVMNSLLGGVNAQNADNLRAVNNDIATQRLNLGSQLSGDTLGYYERGQNQLTQSRQFEEQLRQQQQQSLFALNPYDPAAQARQALQARQRRMTYGQFTGPNNNPY